MRHVFALALLAVLSSASHAIPVLTLDSFDPGPPASIDVAIQDTGSGLDQIDVLVANNVTVTIPPFTPGTNLPIISVTELINQAMDGLVRYEAFDVTGASTVAEFHFNANGVVDKVPEPITLALVGLGIAGMGYQRSRKAKVA